MYFQNLYNTDTSDDLISETITEMNYSLIGWYLQTYGMQNTLAFIHWLGVPVLLNSDKQKSPAVDKSDAEKQRKLDHLLNGYDDFERKINYKFQNKAYLLQSVSHESFDSNDVTPSYKGLDFIGDAILNYVIVRYLFRQSNQLAADDLKNMSWLLYCNSSLATVSVRNKLHKYLRYTLPGIRDSISYFETFLQRNQFKPINDVWWIVLDTFYAKNVNIY